MTGLQMHYRRPRCSVSAESARHCSAEGAVTPAVPSIVPLHGILPLKRITRNRGAFLVHLNVFDTQLSLQR